jgi:hypothetical protein
MCFAGYVDKLLDLLFTSVVNDPTVYQELASDIVIPPSLCSGYTHPDIHEAVNARARRFNYSS